MGNRVGEIGDIGKEGLAMKEDIVIKRLSGEDIYKSGIRGKLVRKVECNDFVWCISSANVYQFFCLNNVFNYCKFFTIKSKEKENTKIAGCRFTSIINSDKEEVWYAITPNGFKILLEEEMEIWPDWDHPTEIRRREIIDRFKEIGTIEKELLVEGAKLKKELLDL